MASYFFVILTQKNQLRRDGTATIRLRITQHGKQEYINTHLHTLPEHFDKKLGEVNGDHPNRKVINTRLADIDNKRHRALLDINESEYTAKHLKSYLEEVLNLDGSGKVRLKQFVTFSGYVDNLIATLKEQEDDNTAEWHKYAIQGLRKALGKKDITFSEMNASVLKKVEQYWKTKGAANEIKHGRYKGMVKTLTNGGVNNYMRALRSAWNKADLELNDDNGNGPVPGNIWKRYKLPTGDTNKSKEKAITVKELRKLIKVKLEPGTGIYRTRDYLIWSFCMVGIYAVDAYNLETMYNGCILYQRQKLTEKRWIEVKIEPETLVYMNRLKGEKRLLMFKEVYTSDHKSMTRAMGKNCKVLAEMVGLDAGFSPEWMRHTWATIARNDCKASVDDVGFCLGHKDDRVTDVYIKDSHKLRHDINRKVLNKVFSGIDLNNI